MVTGNVISLDQTFGKKYACFKLVINFNSYKLIKVITIRIQDLK